MTDVWCCSACDAEALVALGRALGEVVEGPVCIRLEGDLGAGKTTLVQGVAEGLGVASAVLSPTFSLMDEHDGRLPLLHADLYRLTAGEAEAIGLEEAVDDWPGLVMVEWPCRAEHLLPEDGLRVVIEHASVGRSLRVSALGAAGEAVLLAWRKAVR